nr:hypothetical protein [Tanacetum cinerariifolium]
MPPPDPNNTYIQPSLEIQILEFINTLGYDEVLKKVDCRFKNDRHKSSSTMESYCECTQQMSYGKRLELKNLSKKKQPVAGEGSSVAHNKHYADSDTDSDATLYSLSLDELEESAKETDDADESDMDLSNDNLQGYDDVTSDATLYSSSLDESEESSNETDDADESDMDLSNDNLHGDDDATRYGVFMHNKSTVTPNSTYLSPSVTSSSLDFIQTFIDKTPTNVLTDFMSHPVYTDAQKSLVVHNLEVMFQDKNAHHIPSLLAKKIPYPTTHPQPSSLQAKAKKLMQKAKKNMRKINFKKAVVQKLREYDQKIEAIRNFNVSEAIKKAVQAKVLSEIKKILPTHILNAIENYGDDDATRYGVFMHNKSTVTPNSAYLSSSVTSFSLDFIQTFIDETPTNVLMDFMSYQVYTDAQKSLVVDNPEGNPELTSYISSVSEVPLGTHVDVLATKTLQQEMFQDKNTHHIPSLPAMKIPYPTTHP